MREDLGKWMDSLVDHAKWLGTLETQASYSSFVGASTGEQGAERTLKT